MKIILVGTGSPELGPKNTRAGSSAAIVIGDDILLFDCGRWITLRLCQAGIHPRQVTHLFITHKFHLDHTVNYYDFLFSNARGGSGPQQGPGGPRPRPQQGPGGSRLSVYGPPGMKEYTTDLLDVHVKHGDRGRAGAARNVLDNVFDYKEKGTICSGNGWKVDATNVDVSKNWAPTIIYRVEHENKSAVIAWDIHPTHPRQRNSHFEYDDTYTSRKELMDIMEGADIVLADAMEIHTTPEGIGIAAEKAKVKKVVLTHLSGPGTQWPPLDPKIMKERAKTRFNGEVIIGEDLMVLEI